MSEENNLVALAQRISMNSSILVKEMSSADKLEDALDKNVDVANLHKNLGFTLCCTSLALNKLKGEKPNPEILKSVKQFQEREKQINQLPNPSSTEAAASLNKKDLDLRKRSKC